MAKAGMSLFGERKPKVRPQLLESASISDFGGGLNVVDNDVTMKSRFAKVLNNCNKGTDGSMSVRWGTKFRFDVTGAVTGDIIETAYFEKHIVAFTTTGQIAKITEAGVVTAIWNDTIAAALFGAPDGWSTGLAEGSIDITEFKGEMVAVNGIDKPLLIEKDLTVGYLQDPATGSNVNTPISKYVTTVSNFTVMAGIEDEEMDIYVSSQGTSGVWVGDDPPNDGLVFSIGAWVPQNSGEILGIGSFRNYLIVTFEGAVVVVELGTYEGDVHKPAVQDNIIGFGSVSHRTMISTRGDFMMADVLGWHSAFKTAYGLIDTKPLSEMVNPAYIADVPLTTVGRKKAFSVRNQLENRIMTFLPTDTGAVTGWVLTSSSKEEIKSPAWNTVSGWNWTCGCSSERGRIFFAKGTRIYQYGNDTFEDEAYTADLLGDYDDDWATATAYVAGDRVLFDDVVYSCVTTHMSDAFADDLAEELWEVWEGVPIDFEWELPWTDINARTRKKFLKYIQADTKGTAGFTIQFFVDNFYRDVLTDELTPQLVMEFVAGDSGGFGSGDQPYGGGRRLRDERPWGVPAQFKILKLRLLGTTTKPLKVIMLNIFYFIGTHRR